MKSIDRKTKHIMTGAILAVLVWLLLPARNGLTETGVRTLAVSVLTVYYWSTIGIDWCSVLAMALFAMVGTDKMSSLLGAGFANTNSALVLFSSMLTLALHYCGVMERVIIWFISRNIIRKRPYVFFTLYFLSIFLLACVANGTSICLLTLPFTQNLLDELGYTKEEKFTKALYSGVVSAAMIGFFATPISKSVALAIIGAVESSFGVQISFVKYMMVCMPVALVLFVVNMLVIRFVFHPDTSRFVNYDVDAKRALLTKLGNREKATVILFLITISFYFLPELLQFALPGFYTYIKNLTVVTPTILGVCAMVIIRVDGEPLLDFKKCLRDVSWSTYFMIAGMFILSAALSAESTGIVTWLTGMLEPVTTHIDSWVLFVLLISSFCVILTNFMSCNVIANIAFLISLPLLISMNGMVNNCALAMVIVIGSSMGVMTPQASGSAAVYLATENYTPADGMKYGFWVIPATVVACLVMAYPLGTIVF